ncbi:hypothetical protein SAMN04487895_104211 [Paenibacillus sophorae]|uniref:Copper amine oxidase N-terminal domain-containing protein n=1 Tax=Paenibacillus sophorae TaxID=1333845 RepID=A0A1H8L7C5_9BACL|nr:hypothetical protein [Paenibacillus sophorae]QWU17403.1 hypothetical protein KP014_09745 [Paenibacillus sophorae]SEO00981.1 hypothetical protein SAMN04487895_104211 [Paenibacillus sophorae]
MKKFIAGLISGLLLMSAASVFGENSGSTVPGTVVPLDSTKYPQVEYSKPGVALAVYSGKDSGLFIPTYDADLSKIILKDNGKESVIFNSPKSGLVVAGHDKLTLSGDTIKLAPTEQGKVIVPNWSSVSNGNKSLQAELNDLQKQITELQKQLADLQK